MKILLFTQTGDARPKCVKSFGDRRHNAMNYFSAIVPRFGREGQPLSGWLVECASADDGRTIIMQERVFDGTGIKSTLGRILASGGRDGGK